MIKCSRYCTDVVYHVSDINSIHRYYNLDRIGVRGILVDIDIFPLLDDRSHCWHSRTVQRN